MTYVDMLFWRAITAADFFTIERSRDALPAGGGGQSYISISFAGLTHEELGRFLGVDPPNRIETERPRVELDGVGVVTDPTEVGNLVFAPRYQLPQADDRYRITTQNRQTQTRHPAWTARRGFPKAPDDVRSTDDPRMPDLTNLKVYVALLDSGEYVAGYVNRASLPPGAPAKLSALFGPYDQQRSAGLIEFASNELLVDSLVAATLASSRPEEFEGVSPEVATALDETREAAGKAPSGQGRRQSVAERLAIEKHAMKMAEEQVRDEGWTRVEDVSLFRPYDLHCYRRDGRELRVEVKGTTGDGSSILLTPNEVQHARERSDVVLIVVSKIELVVSDESDEVDARNGVVEVVSPWDVDAGGELRPTGYEWRRPTSG